MKMKRYAQLFNHVNISRTKKLSRGTKSGSSVLLIELIRALADSLSSDVVLVARNDGVVPLCKRRPVLGCTPLHSLAPKHAIMKRHGGGGGGGGEEGTNKTLSSPGHEHCLNNIWKFLSPDYDKISSTPNMTSV